MAELIGPSWHVFERCPQCGARVGAPCVSLRPGQVHPMRNPHPRRRQRGPRAARHA